MIERSITKRDGYVYMGYSITSNYDGTEYYIPGLTSRKFKTLNATEKFLRTYWERSS